MTSQAEVFMKYFSAQFEKTAEISKKQINKMAKYAKDAFTDVGRSGFSFNVGMKKSAKVMGKVAKTTVKKVGKGFKWMGTKMLGVFGWLLSLIESLGVLEPLFDVINGLIEIFGGMLTQALMPAFMKLFDVLLSPTVIEIITILANLIGSILTPIIEVFTNVLTAVLPLILNLVSLFADLLQPVIEAFMPILHILGDLFVAFLTPIIGTFSVILEALSPLFEVFATILKAFAPILKTLEPILEIVGKLFGILIVIGLLPLMYALYGVGLVIAGFIDLFKIGKPTTEAWKGMMGPIIDSLVGSIPTIMAMQHGGLITSPTIALLGEKGPEVVTPLKDLNGIGNNDRIMWALEDNKKELELINTQLYEFNRLQRNKVRG